MESFLGVIHLIVKIYLLYKGQLLELWLVQNLEIHAETCLKD
jgi:hypothetical protein